MHADTLLLSRCTLSEPVLVTAMGGVAALFTQARNPDGATNEDGAALIPCGANATVLAVADGVGGKASGEEASAVVLESLAASVQSLRGEAEGLRAAVLDGIEQASADVQAKGTGAATTLAAVAIEGSTIRPFHVGDCEILLVSQRGRVHFEVVPHSPVGYAVESGMLGEDEAFDHRDRHLVSNVVGAPDMRIEIGPPMTMQARDTLLLASDGLFDNLRQHEIAAVIGTGPLSLVARRLADAALRRARGEDPHSPGKPDDVTFLLYRPTVHAADRPILEAAVRP